VCVPRADVGNCFCAACDCCDNYCCYREPYGFEAGAGDSSDASGETLDAAKAPPDVAMTDVTNDIATDIAMVPPDVALRDVTNDVAAGTASDATTDGGGQ
jgi:hypothetical protein